MNSDTHPKMPGPALAHCLLFSLVLSTAAGVAQAAPAQIPAVELKAALHFPDGKPGRPTYLRTVKRRFDAGAGPIGELQGGWFCGRRGDIQWNNKTSEAILPNGQITARFKQLLQQANFPVPTPSDALFEEKANVGASKERKDELHVGVLIKEVSTNLCSKSTNSWTGEAYLKLFWQVFAPEQQKVVFETTTEGRFHTADKALDGQVSAIPVEAFVAAARNLLAEPGFLTAVSTPADTTVLAGIAGAIAASAPADNAKLTIDGVATADNDALSKNITLLRTAVATVFGDAGSGSGFFIGRSGWLLTNQHVVGSAKFVKVRLATGRELVGEVQRTAALRDVALVKTEPAGVPPMPIRLTDPAIGEDVYALGSPLGDAFNTTLTRGILSGVREISSQQYLQSDVAILPGNSGGPLLDKSGQVIGITVLGLGAKGIAGMNFFVPVSDAIGKLGLQIQTAATR
ncbi:S1C family serine protease [Roseateles saccharophilus]|nr:serine protease [Roseateles saccharophilus]